MKVKNLFSKKKLGFASVLILVSLFVGGRVGAGYWPGRSMDIEEEKETTPTSTILHERIEKEEDGTEILDEKEIDFFHQKRLEFLNQIGFEYFKKKRYPESYMCFKIAAKEGFAVAQYNVGFMHRYGVRKKINCRKAMKWLEKSAEQNDSHAEFDLGVLYCMEGYFAYALKYFKRAASQENVCAKSNLGVLYKDYFENYEEAIEWFLKASDLDEAQYNIGIMYRDGLALPQDFDKALKWFKKAAEQGHVKAERCVIETQYNIGVKYYRDKNYAKALPLFKKAAKSGLVGAQYMAGIIYRDGLSGEKDTEKALKWLREAAYSTDPEWKEDSINAQYNLGIMYHKGQGVPQNIHQALIWLKKAAAQGHVDAQRAIKNINQEK